MELQRVGSGVELSREGVGLRWGEWRSVALTEGGSGQCGVCADVFKWLSNGVVWAVLVQTGWLCMLLSYVVPGTYVPIRPGGARPQLPPSL